MMPTCSTVKKFKFNYCVGTSYYRLISGRIWKLSKFFCTKSVFFSAQLVSALRLLVLFPLRKFCSVWYFGVQMFFLTCLPRIFFCKNRYYESVWDRFFFNYKLVKFKWNALLNLITNCKILSSFLKNSATNFQKMVSIEGPLLFLCDCVLHWSLFILPLCLQPSQKSVGEYFTNFFLMFFFRFLED